MSEANLPEEREQQKELPVELLSRWVETQGMELEVRREENQTQRLRDEQNHEYAMHVAQLQAGFHEREVASDDKTNRLRLQFYGAFAFGIGAFLLMILWLGGQKIFLTVLTQVLPAVIAGVSGYVFGMSRGKAAATQFVEQDEQ